MTGARDLYGRASRRVGIVGHGAERGRIAQAGRAPSRGDHGRRQRGRGGSKPSRLLPLLLLLLLLLFPRTESKGLRPRRRRGEGIKRTPIGA